MTNKNDHNSKARSRKKTSVKEIKPIARDEFTSTRSAAQEKPEKKTRGRKKTKIMTQADKLSLPIGRRGTRIMTPGEKERLYKIVFEEANELFKNIPLPSKRRATITDAVRMVIESSILDEEEED